MPYKIKGGAMKGEYHNSLVSDTCVKLDGLCTRVDTSTPFLAWKANVALDPFFVQYCTYLAHDTKHRSVLDILCNA